MEKKIVGLSSALESSVFPHRAGLNSSFRDLHLLIGRRRHRRRAGQGYASTSAGAPPPPLCAKERGGQARRTCTEV